MNVNTTTFLGDKPINRMGYGAMQLAGPGVFGPPPNPAAARAVLRRAIELGVAIAATVAFTHTKTLLASGHSPAQAATSGFALGFWVIAGISAAAVVACLALVGGRELEQTAVPVRVIQPAET